MSVTEKAMTYEAGHVVSTQVPVIRKKERVKERAVSKAVSKKVFDEVRLKGLQVLLLVVLLAMWEIGAHNGSISTFLFSSPSNIIKTLVRALSSGELFTDLWTTGKETVIGFALGSIIGSAIGLLLWCSDFLAKFSKPYVAALGSIPVLVLSPMIIIWFGTGIASKIAIVTFSCVFVSLFSAYEGAVQVDQDLINLMRSFGASKFQIFRKVVVPSSMSWVISGFKMNIGFALIGAIIGEYISSKAGIGYMILRGSTSFDMNVTIAGLVAAMVFVFALNVLVKLLDRILLKWKYEPYKS